MHIPVLLKESIDALNIVSNGIYVDLTLGEAGHTIRILQEKKDCFVYGIDRDQMAINISAEKLEKFKDRFKLIKTDFANFRNELALLKIDKVDGILIDLGVSTGQITNSSRGFSYKNDGKLDMRMDKSLPMSAWEVINNFSEEELKSIIFRYGNERRAAYFAKKIVLLRPIETTHQLAKIIGQNNIKSLSRVFQAIRIFINSELIQIENVLPNAISALNIGGRIVIISYHSLEDRIVKNFFLDEAKSCICPPNLPKCVCSKRTRIKILTKKPILPSSREIEKNKKSRSAKLRVAQRM